MFRLGLSICIISGPTRIEGIIINLKWIDTLLKPRGAT